MTTEVAKGDPAGATSARVLNAIVRAAQLRVQQGVQIVKVQDGETHTLLRPLAEDLSVALGVPVAVVREAAGHGVAIGSLSALHDDQEQVIAIRALTF